MAQVRHKGLHFHIHTQVEDSISTIRPILRSDQLASRLCEPTVSPFHLAVSAAAAAAAHGNYCMTLSTLLLGYDWNLWIAGR